MRRTLATRLRPLSDGLNLQGLSVAEGVRAALSVAVIIALNEYFQWPPLIEAAVGALNTCMCDPGGPIRRRVPVLVTFSLLAALIVAVVGLLRGAGIAVALPLGMAGLFCATFVRIYGETFQQVGVLLGVMLILSIDRAVPDVTQAAILAATSLGGASWAILLTLVIWRIQPYLPARRAVAAAYRALSGVAENLRALVQSGETGETAWDAHAQTQLAAARAAIETARQAVTDTLRARGGASEQARHGLIRLEAADQLLGALIAFGDTLQHTGAPQREIAQRLLQMLAATLLEFADSIAADGVSTDRPLGQAISAMASAAAALPEADPARSIAEQIIERLQIAYLLSVPANFLPGAGLDGTPPDFGQRLLQPLRANLDWRSPAFRHALRLTVAATPALAFTMLWYTPYDHWLTITIVMTMQPYFGLTYARVLQRIAGTVAGGLVAALVGVVCTTPIALAAAMFPLAMVTMAARALSYGLFVALLTPLIVLLVDVTQPDASEWLIAGLRGLFTVVGGSVAVAACFLLWPNFEPQRLLPEMRAAITAHGRYAASVISNLLGEPPAVPLGRIRRDAGIASNGLETSINRALAERSPGSRAALEAAMVIDAALRRCAGRVTAIMLDPAMRTALPQQSWRDWRDWIAQSTAALGSGGTKLRAPPAPATESVMRIRRQLDLIAGALERLPG